MTRLTYHYRLLWIGVAALVATPVAGATQNLPTSDPPPSVPGPSNPDAEGSDRTLEFAADQVDYDDANDIVTASGNVTLTRDVWYLRADQVTWNRTSGAVRARGNVIMTGPQGDTAYGDSAELTDSLRDGVIENLLVVFDSGGRVAANSGERMANGDMALNQATFSPYRAEDADGTPRTPTWQVRAARVYYDRAHNRVRYEGARIELFGLTLGPMPFLSHPAIGIPGTGLLVPDLRIDRVNGFELSLPYYLRFGDTSDLTLTPHIYSNVAPMAQAEFRALTANGAIRLQGFGTVSQRAAAGIPGAVQQSAFRGYFDATAGFQFDPRWSLSASARIATDRTVSFQTYHR